MSDQKQSSGSPLVDRAIPPISDMMMRMKIRDTLLALIADNQRILSEDLEAKRLPANGMAKAAIDGFKASHQMAGNLATTSGSQDSFVDAWQEALQIFSIAQLAMGSAIGAKAVAIKRARGAAKAGHANSPQAQAKAVAKELWIRWQADDTLYASKAAFARDILGKFPDELKSQPVVEGWCRKWENAKS